MLRVDVRVTCDVCDCDQATAHTYLSARAQSRSLAAEDAVAVSDTVTRALYEALQRGAMFSTRQRVYCVSCRPVGAAS